MKRKTPFSWTPESIPDLSGKTVLITGANSGLGLESARLLAGRGAHVMMACRDMEKGETARQAVEKEHPQGSLEVMRLDLSDLDSVRHFSNEFQLRHSVLDVLLNNADSDFFRNLEESQVQ